MSQPNFQDPVHEKRIARDAVWEAPRRIAVAAEVDVLVAGGGPAGIAAAIAAAQHGARVLIVERHGMLGGVWTAGLLNPLFDHARKGYVVAELIERLKA
ncbi:MAG: FAD-dependent oxidoreductase, partial [Armatimonadota bacterium]|nr:FAD-dependent oxidoreductase [Armatimonadota bacterium]